MRKNYFIYFILLLCFQAQAQKPTPTFINPSKKQLFKVVKTPKLNKEQLIRYNSIIARQEHDFLEVVVTDYLPSYVHPKSRKIKFDIPVLRHVKQPLKKTPIVKVELQTARYEKEGGLFTGNPNFVWYGKAIQPIAGVKPGGGIINWPPVLPPQYPCPPFCLPNPPNEDPACRMADMTIIQSASGTYGMLNLDNTAYQLFELTGGLQVLAKVSDTKMKEPAICGFEADKGSGGKPSKNAIEKPNSFKENKFDDATIEVLQKTPDCVIDLLVLYTSAALAAYPDIEDRTDVANENTNNALFNSDLPDVSFNVVHKQLFDHPDITETNWGSDIGDLPDIQEAMCLRDEVGADIVVLLTDDTYSGIAGVAATLGPNDDLSYCIVETGFMLEIRHTYAHEIGHLMGGHHDDSGLPYQQAKVFTATNECDESAFVGTIISAGGSGFEYRVLHYSNPDVDFWDTSTGEVNRDNARRIEETALTVSGFRNSGGFSNQSIQHWPNTTCPCNYSFVITDPSAATYSWELYEEITPGSGSFSLVFTDNTSSFVLQEYGGCDETTNYIISVTYETTSGCEVTPDAVWHTTGVQPPPPCMALKNDGDEEATITLETLDNYIVYPNPASDYLNLSISDELPENIVFEIYGINGELKRKWSILDNEERLDINDLNTGLYTYLIYSDSDVLKRGKMVVTK